MLCEKSKKKRLITNNIVRILKDFFLCWILENSDYFKSEKK